MVLVPVGYITRTLGLDGGCVDGWMDGWVWVSVLLKASFRIFKGGWDRVDGYRIVSYGTVLGALGLVGGGSSESLCGFGEGGREVVCGCGFWWYTYERVLVVANELENSLKLELRDISLVPVFYDTCGGLEVW